MQNNMDLLHSMTSAGGDLRTPPRSTEYLREINHRGHDESLVRVNSDQGAKEQLDLVASKVHDTIQEIKAVYSEIGFSESEMAIKKNEIFETITETISTFTQNLQREKTSIQNECDWLRQQIHLIFSILNEERGEKVLSLSDRWLLFKDDPQVQQEIATEKSKWKKMQESQILILNQSANTKYSFSGLLLNSTVNDAFLQRCWQEPVYSLLQTKSRLNSIFLEALKTFVRVFRKFNELNVAFWDNIEVITEDWAPGAIDSFLCSIPSKPEATAHGKLIKDFDCMLADLKLSDRRLDHNVKEPDSANDRFAFIISSPSKHNSKTSDDSSVLYHNRCLSLEEEMSRLRDINYNIVRTIRNLKISKFTPDVIGKMQKAVENTEDEIRSRVIHIREKLAVCLELTKALSLEENDVITILKEPAVINPEINHFVSSEGQIEVETLHFIFDNPHELGLKDQHINFISKLMKTLQTIKSAKDERLQSSKAACLRLWKTLNEDKSYVDDFISRNDNLTDDSLRNFDIELTRLQEKRREFIEEFIELTRHEIDKYHKLLYHTVSQRQEFRYHNLDLNLTTEDKEKILCEHENELDRLKKEFEAKLTIFSLYQELKELVNNQKFLIESSKNSKRLLEKNSCQTLLNEERIRKKVMRNMPRVLSSIKKEILAFNDDLIVRGGKAINVGEMDLFEEVLMIEAEVDNQRPRKVSQSRPVKDYSRPASPVKLKNSSRKTSPIKRQSPHKVTKFSTRNSLSPLKAKASFTKSTSSIGQPSSIPRLISRESVDSFQMKSNGFRSPPLRARHNFSLQSSPRQIISPTSQVDPSIQSSRLLSNRLQPLQSPLPPDAPNDMYSDMRESSTLYSTCSRLSPLRGDSLSNIRRDSIAKKPVFSSTEIEKENSVIMPHSSDETSTLSPVRFDSKMNSEIQSSRLTTNSLANSTILGDDYLTWREERIRELNG